MSATFVLPLICRTVRQRHAITVPGSGVGALQPGAREAELFDWKVARVVVRPDEEVRL